MKIECCIVQHVICSVATGSAPTESEISSATTASSTSATAASSARCSTHPSYTYFSLESQMYHFFNNAQSSGGTSWQGISSTDSTWTKKKESTDQGERGDDATKDWRKQRRHSTTHPKMRIRTEEEDLKTMQQRIKIGQGTTNNQRLKTFKTSICSTFLSVTLPRLSTLLTQIGLLLFSSNKIDQVTSNSYMISSLVNP